MQSYTLLRVCSSIVLHSLFFCLIISCQTIETNTIENATNMTNETLPQNVTNSTNNEQIIIHSNEDNQTVGNSVTDEPKPLIKLKTEQTVLNDGNTESLKNITDFVVLDSLSTNSGVKGLPDIPTGPAIITLVPNPADVTLENVLKEEFATLDTNSTNESADIVEILKSHLDLNNSINETKLPITTDEVPIEKDVLFPQDVPPDGQVNIVNDTGGIGNTPTDAVTTKDGIAVGDAAVLNLTVDTNQIPVFSEWAQQRMEEAEKKLEQDIVNASAHKKNSTSGHKTPVVKLRVKNYASPDCGAKIIAANSESSSTGSVLSMTKDEYLLSPCTSRIWFVVELCEAIQAEIVDLANFELFSSSPKNFSVSVSNRFPTREWRNVGRFTAKDERNIQRFDLHPHLFGKYVRVDIHSHYNSEHFCPISLFRVYGTSEFEAFETENRIHVEEDMVDDDDDGQILDPQKSGKKGDDNNIFKSANDAVMSIVKKAASFLKPSANKTNADAVDQLATSVDEKHNVWYMCLNFEVICRNCTEHMKKEVIDLLSCKQRLLTSLLGLDLIKKNIQKSQICANVVGVNISTNGCTHSFGNFSAMHLTDYRKDYVSNLIPISYVVALCNLLAATAKQPTLLKFQYGNKIGLSDTVAGSVTLDTNAKNQMNVPDLVIDQSDGEQKDSLKMGKITESDQQKDILLEKAEGNDSVQIQQTKQSQTIDQPINVKGDQDINGIEQQAPPIVNAENDNETTTGSQKNKKQEQDTMLPKQLHQEELKENSTLDDTANINTTWDSLDEVFLAESTTEANIALGGTDEQVNGATAIPQVGQKVHSESVFLRLSNRIKALERNMSLSGQYLEELSRRYKKQVEELQQSFAKTLVIIDEQNKRNADREQALTEQIQTLRSNVEELTDQIFYIGVFAFIQGIVWIILRMLSRRGNNVPRNMAQNSVSNSLKNKNKIKAVLLRRKSLDEISSHSSPICQKKRRPSEEALNISGTYKDLLILEESDCKNLNTEEYDSFSDTNKRKNKQKNRKILSVKRTMSLDTNEKKKKKILPRQDSAPDEYEFLKQIATVKNARIDDQPALDENYEIYLPGSDLGYNEFMPDGPSGIENVSNTSQQSNGSITLNADSSSNSSNKSKTRRLSSPAFIKSHFSRSQRKKMIQESATGWEWYRLKKEPNASQLKNSKKSKSESPEVKLNGSTNGADRTVNGRESTKGTLSIGSSNVIDKKKSGSFRRILHKDFWLDKFSDNNNV